MSDLRKLSEAATPGGWEAVPNNVFWELKPANRRAADPYTVADFCASEPDKRDGGIQEANVRFVAALVNEFRSGSLIPRAEHERVLALLAEAREAIHKALSNMTAPHADFATNSCMCGADGNYASQYGCDGHNYTDSGWYYAGEAIDAASATLSRIDDALAADVEARG